MRGIWNFARSKAGLASAAAAGLVWSMVTAALAVSVFLPPGGTVGVPPTTAATEPDLAGVVIHDALVPFTIRNPAGGVLCAGQLQDRVVQSSRTQQLHFYYRIRTTSGPGAINRMATASFANLALRVAFRTDGLGMVPPRLATRGAVPGPLVTFTLTDPVLSCAHHQESRFILIKTPAKIFHVGGNTRVIATTGASAVVPTVMP